MNKLFLIQNLPFWGLGIPGFLLILFSLWKDVNKPKEEIKLKLKQNKYE